MDKSNSCACFRFQNCDVSGECRAMCPSLSFDSSGVAAHVKAMPVEFLWGCDVSKDLDLQVQSL